MLRERDLAVLLELFVPDQSVAVRGEARDHVVQTVAVDVVGIHLGATLRERKLVKRPNRIARQRSRLLPPTILLQQVEPPVSVHVANAHAVSKLAILVVGRDRMKLPRLSGFAPVRFGVAVKSF